MAATEQVVDPFGFWAFIQQADGLSRTILVIMVLMSLASWYIILTKLWDQGRMARSYVEAQKKFWTAGSLHDGMAALSGKDNVFRMLAEDGMRASQYHQGHLTQQVPLNDWINMSLYRSLESVSARLSLGLSLLATTGSVSPFVGLLGTVWGIRNALSKISITGDPSLEHIAGPIGEALIMTAIGLFVAVPAVVGYNWLLRRNRTMNDKMKAFAADVHSYLVGGARFDINTPVLRAVPARAAAAK